MGATVEEVDELGSLMKLQGYSCITLERLRSGFLTAQVIAEEKKLRLVLDTGASGTWLDAERTSAMNLKWSKVPGGAPSENDPDWAPSPQAEVGGFDFGAFKTGPMRVGTYRVSALNEHLALYGDPLVDGVLGGDILSAYSARIDYPGRRLYLRSGH
jgi:hypothetical protein